MNIRGCPERVFNPTDGACCFFKVRGLRSGVGYLCAVVVKDHSLKLALGYIWRGMTRLFPRCDLPLRLYRGLFFVVTRVLTTAWLLGSL